MSHIPDEPTRQHLIHAIENASPRPHHSALLAAIDNIIPNSAFRFVLSKGGWHRAGGVLVADGRRLSQDLEPWVNTELAKCDDDFALFVERFGEAGLLVTRHTGCTHYFVAPYGPAPEDFLQLEVEELQEVMDRVLIDPAQPAQDRTELVEPTNYTKLAAHPVGSPTYRFVRLTDIRQVLVRQRSQGNASSPLARFMSDWVDSRASDNAHFCEHWLIGGLEHYQVDATTTFTATPLSLHLRTLKSFPWDASKTGVELGSQVRDFDRAAGYSGAWYFHLVASNLVPDSLVQALKRDLDNGYHYLAEKDLGLLEKLMVTPYQAGVAS